MFSIIAFAAVSAAVVLAAPVQKLVPFSQEGEIIPGSYLIKFKKGVDAKVAKALSESVKAKKFYNIEDNFIGFAGEFSDNVLASLRLRTDMLDYIEANQVARTSAQQVNPPSWGLGASSSTTAQNPTPAVYNYPNSAGTGVKIYIIDTGIRISHDDFGNRATWGARFGNGGNEDGNGHGTHCAGTAAGSSYGIAKNASLVAVGVLGPAGSGSYDDVVDGINWAASNCGNSQCVGSMSLGGGFSQMVNDAVTDFVTPANRFMAVAAGNSNVDAANTSPASADGAYTVMATDSLARKASYSNYGRVCSIWAPGSSITSAWIDSDSDTNTISGTSMACPHVAGAGALAFSTGNGANVESFLTSNSISGVISGVPAGTTGNFLHIRENW